MANNLLPVRLETSYIHYIYYIHLIFSDQAYYFMKNIPGSPAYWKTFHFDVAAMIKQLGPPTQWMTFSCADLTWNEIYRILSKLKG